MILLWGLHEDRPIASVAAALQTAGEPFLFVDQRRVLESEIELDVDSCVGGRLRVGDETVDLASVTGAYVRPYDTTRIGAIARAGQGSPQERHGLSFDDTLWLWAELTQALVVNRPAAMAANNSKPRQAQQIRRHGFRIPDTLITTDPGAARAFLSEHRGVVYKSISATRSIVSRLPVDEHDRLADVAWCPTQFQEHVAGIDHRVHVVGDELFCTRIESTADDYRYGSRDGAQMSVRGVTLPDDAARRCRTLAAAMQYSVAGIDLRLTPDGDWVCFEVNPSPAFTFYDRDGLGIAEAVARLLSTPGAAA